jgi:DMSO reductase family type II enzyme heme b subunit
MPSWEHLPEEDRWALVYYLRYLTELGKQVESGKIKLEALKKDLGWEQKKDLAVSKLDPANVIQIPQVPEMTQEGLIHGRDLFVKGCASCHGLQGKGDGQMMMKDSFGIPIRPRDLTAGIFKGEPTPQALYLRFALGLPGSPMPSYKDAFTEEQLWDLVYYTLTLPEGGKMDRALMSRHFIKAKKMEGSDLGPGASDWERVQGQEINLMPLWWRDDRVESVKVKAAHDGANLYLQLSWADQTKDDQAGAVTDFSDGAAVQFSKDADPPLFAMGSVGQAVSFWHWKAAWENAVDPEEMIEKRYPNYAHATPPKELYHQFLSGQDAGNPVSNLDLKQGAEEGHSKGIGSYTAVKIQAEAVEAKSLWKDGRWHVVFKRELKVEDSDRIEFGQGKTIHIAFAVWDGSKQDRNGQKMVSIWNELTVE